MSQQGHCPFHTIQQHSACGTPKKCYIFKDYLISLQSLGYQYGNIFYKIIIIKRIKIIFDLSNIIFCYNNPHLCTVQLRHDYVIATGHFYVPRLLRNPARSSVFNISGIIIIIIIIILLKQDYKIQLTNNKIQMAWLTSWLVVW